MIRQELKKNPDKLLTRFGIFLGVLAVLYFGREAIFNLTPVAKSLLLVISSAFFLGGSKIVDDDGTVTAFYLFSALSYLTFLVYYIARLDPSSSTVFLLLAVSAGIFILIGKKIDEYEFHEEKAKKTGLLLVIATIGLIAVDLNAPEVEYETDFETSIQISESPVTAGTVTVKNSYVFPQTFNIDRFETCSTDERRFRLNPEDHSDLSGIVDGLSEETVEYRIMELPREDGNTSPEAFSIVETEECPENPEQRTVYIYQTPNPD
jgi:hypothetical protein